jgi:membrane protease YdiL (CAAX protease family)
LINLRWDIGLTIPADRPWGKIYAFALAITLAGFAISALQGAYNGMIRGTEGGPGTTSPALEIAGAFTVPVAVAVIAEIGYRGIMFPRVQKAFGLWPAVLIVGFINTVAHRWEDYSPRWLGMFVLLAGLCYLRHMSGSVVPPLVTHVVMNIVVAIGFWFWGPWDQGAMSTSWLAAFAVLALISLAVAIYLARSDRRQFYRQP